MRKMSGREHLQRPRLKSKESRRILKARETLTAQEVEFLKSHCITEKAKWEGFAITLWLFFIKRNWILFLNSWMDKLSSLSNRKWETKWTNLQMRMMMNNKMWLAMNSFHLIAKLSFQENTTREKAKHRII